MQTPAAPVSRFDDLRWAIVLSACIGAAIALAALILLLVLGYFSTATGPESLARTELGTFTKNAVLVAILVAGVLSATWSGRGAALSALASGALAHVALVTGAGVVLLVGLPILTPGPGATPIQATTSPAPTGSAPARVAEPCEETFGKDSPLCAAQASAPAAPGLPSLPAQTLGSAAEVVTFANVLRVALAGIVPAALLGTVGVVVRRRRPR